MSLFFEKIPIKLQLLIFQLKNKIKKHAEKKEKCTKTLAQI